MLKPQCNTCRTLISLDGVWEYTIKEGSWEKGFKADGVLAVPASWNEQQTELYHYKKNLWYQKKFELPLLRQGERLLLRFSGILYYGSFYLNGEKLGDDLLGHMPNEFDITDMVREGENLVCACICGDRYESQAVGHGDFYEYGGIHRPVTLEIVPAERVLDLKVRTSYTGELHLDWKVSGGDRITFEVSGEKFTFAAEDSSGSVTVKNIEPWSPETPKLYSLRATLYKEETILDTYTLRIGFRTFETRGRKLFLNGKECQLIGFCRHEDFYVIGKGVNHALNIRDFDLMKWCGANSFRTSHYPYCEEILDLADELGFMVIDELPFGSMDEKLLSDKELRKCALKMVEKFIHRDYNHASVVTWSLGNECKLQAPESEGFFHDVSQKARECDPFRPMTLVGFTRPGEDYAYKFADIVGINRYFGWYGYPQWGRPGEPGDLTRARELLDKELDVFRETIGEKPIVMTEFGADAIAGHHSMYCLQFTEEFQAEMLKTYIQLFQSRTDIAGMHIWHFADFSTNQDPLRVQGNRKGIFSRNREPKIAAYAVRKLWTGKDFSLQSLDVTKHR